MQEIIEAVLRENGAMGVNAIADGIGRPVSTVHKFLEKQRYFLKTTDRKWDLPERVIGGFELKAQVAVIRDILASVENTLSILDSMKAKLDSVPSIIDKISQTASVNSTPPVAISPILKKFISNVEQMKKTVKAHLKGIPDEYKELLSNLDYMKLTLAKGAEFVSDELMPELTNLITGDKPNLEESTIALFKQYQLTKNKSAMSVISDGETAQENSP